MVDIEIIKKLREETGAGVGDCKEALDKSKDDFEKAKVYLKQKGVAKAAKKAERSTGEGTLGIYLHPTNEKLAVIVETKCETDFVARNEKFKAFVKNAALQVAGMSPQYISKDDIPKTLVANWKKEIKKERGAMVSAKETEGRVSAKYKELCLLEQPFFKDEGVTIGEMLTELVAVIGENIKISRFVRIRMGEPTIVAETAEKR